MTTQDLQRQQDEREVRRRQDSLTTDLEAVLWRFEHLDGQSPSPLGRYIVLTTLFERLIDRLQSALEEDAARARPWYTKILEQFQLLLGSTGDRLQ